MIMGQLHFIIFVIFVGYFHGLNGKPNDVKIVTNCTLDDLRNIKGDIKSNRLSFTDCNLPAIPDALFFNVANIKSIYFLRSNISAISAFAFNDLDELETLTVVGNSNLTLLQSWTMNNLDKLNQLNLYQNGIRDLETSALQHYPNLTNLILQDNIISVIPDGFFDVSLKIETLNLANNLLKRIDSFTLKALLRLIDLDLSYNRIEYIDQSAFTTTIQLKTLKLNGNLLNSINNILFRNLRQLEYLNLSENALSNHSFDKNAFQYNSQLMQLDVSHNEMIDIETYALNGLKSLEVLNASHNQIASIQSTALNNLSRLKHLDVSNNKLTQLPDSIFASLTSIESIDLSHNELSSIKPFTFTDSKTLQTLNLSTNQLHTDDFLEQAAAIKLIDLQNNQYHELNMMALKSFGTVHLNNNKWNCKWLLMTLAKRENLISNLQFGFDFVDFGFENLSMKLTQDVVCYDYRQSIDKPTIQRIIIIDSDCDALKNEKEKKKKSSINTYPKTFKKLLIEEFDYKACLFWTVVAVFLVIGLVRVGKYCLEQSEKKSERYRIVQQEKVLKDIDEYFAKNNKRKQRA